MKKNILFAALQCCFLFLGFDNLSGQVQQFNQRDSVAHYSIEEITVTAVFVKNKTSPLRINEIERKSILNNAVAATYPEILKGIPGVYATSETGNYGDAKLNIRGFKQENISILLNGIPISGITSSNMYWNNWLGLADATNAIQVQKGIGGSMIADNSVGGTVNILTAQTSENRLISAGMYATSYGLHKFNFSYDSGEMKNGWAAKVMTSYTFGNNYIDATEVNSWSYMLNVSKRFNNKNTLVFTVLGSPETHNQRSSRLTFEEIQKYGVTYNKSWGYYNSKPFNISRNQYHKPYFTLHHLYNNHERLNIVSSAYLALASGGGRWSETKGKKIISYLNEEGQIDWNTVIEENKTAGSSQNILSDYLAGHIQSGATSKLEYRINQKWNIESGFHYQYYWTWEKERITDLLGGQYWLENNTQKGVGDYIRTSNGKTTHHTTIYISGKYKSGNWNGFVGVSTSNSNVQRWDKWNYVDDYKSKWVHGYGYTLKRGILYKVDKKSSVYVNSAVYSRVPYSNVWFSSGNNDITKGVKNERNYLAELGYRYVHNKGNIEINCYYAYWKNKTIYSDPYKQSDESSSKYIINGLDAQHTGIELEAKQHVTHWLMLTGYVTIADWHWTNDVKAIIYDDYTGKELGEVNIYCNGLPVGDAPQTQIGASAIFNINKNLYFEIECQHNARIYADFAPDSRKDAADKIVPYKFPAYTLINCNLNYKGFFIKVNNLFNVEYIERGIDGMNHDLETFTGYWGFGINGSVGVIVTLGGNTPYKK